MRNTLGLVLVGILAIGCGKGRNNATACEPGATQACWGPGACKGGQSCLDDASGWGACDCGTQPATGDAGNNGVFSSDCGVYMLTDLSVTGTSPEDTVAKFLAQSGSTLGDFVSELQPMEEPKIGIGYNPDTGTYAFSQLRYQQLRNGLPVYGGAVRLLVAETEGFPLKLVHSAALNMGSYIPSYGGAEASAADAPSLLEIIESELDLPALAEQVTGESDLVLGKRELVVWAGTKTQCSSPTLAVHFDVLDSRGYSLQSLFVSAADGTVIRHTDLRLSVGVTGEFLAYVTPASGAVCMPGVGTKPVTVPFAHVEVADATGNNPPVRIPWDPRIGAYNAEIAVPDSSDVTGWFEGDYISVIASASNPANGTVDKGTFTILLNDGVVETAQANAYVHASLARSWAATLNPRLAALRRPTRMEVDVNPNSPTDAWSDPIGLIYLTIGMAIPDIIYHEYTHQLVFRTYPFGCSNAYNEGMADLVAASVAASESGRQDFRICGDGNSGTQSLSQSGDRPSNLTACKFTTDHTQCCRTSADPTKVCEIERKYLDCRYSCGTVLAATLWDLRAAVGVELAEYYAMSVLSDWAPPDNQGPFPLGEKDDLPESLLTIDDGKHPEEICRVLELRSWLSERVNKKCCTNPDMKWDPSAVDVAGKPDPKCICTGGRTLNEDVTPHACECPAATPVWNMLSQKCETCTGGRTWNTATKTCECTAGQSWNGTNCVGPQSKAFSGTSSGCATCAGGADCPAGLETCTTATPTPMTLLFDSSGKVTYVGPGIAPVVESKRSGNTFNVVTTDLTQKSRMTLTGTIDETKSPPTITGTIDGTADYRPLLDMVMKQEGSFTLTQVIEPVCDKACPVLASVGCEAWKAGECGGSCALAIATVGTNCHAQAVAVFECQSNQSPESFECTSSGVDMKAGVCANESAASKACAN